MSRAITSLNVGNVNNNPYATIDTHTTRTVAPTNRTTAQPDEIEISDVARNNQLIDELLTFLKDEGQEAQYYDGPTADGLITVWLVAPNGKKKRQYRKNKKTDKWESEDVSEVSTQSVPVTVPTPPNSSLQNKGNNMKINSDNEQTIRWNDYQFNLTRTSMNPITYNVRVSDLNGDTVFRKTFTDKNVSTIMDLLKKDKRLNSSRTVKSSVGRLNARLAGVLDKMNSGLKDLGQFQVTRSDDDSLDAVYYSYEDLPEYTILLHDRNYDGTLYVSLNDEYDTNLYDYVSACQCAPLGYVPDNATDDEIVNKVVHDIAMLEERFADDEVNSSKAIKSNVEGTMKQIKQVVDDGLGFNTQLDGDKAFIHTPNNLIEIDYSKDDDSVYFAVMDNSNNYVQDGFSLEKTDIRELPKRIKKLVDELHDKTYVKSSVDLGTVVKEVKKYCDDNNIDIWGTNDVEDVVKDIAGDKKVLTDEEAESIKTEAINNFKSGVLTSSFAVAVSGTHGKGYIGTGDKLVENIKDAVKYNTQKEADDKCVELQKKTINTDYWTEDTSTMEKTRIQGSREIKSDLSQNVFDEFSGLSYQDAVNKMKIEGYTLVGYGNYNFSEGTVYETYAKGTPTDAEEIELIFNTKDGNATAVDDAILIGEHEDLPAEAAYLLAQGSDYVSSSRKAIKSVAGEEERSSTSDILDDVLALISDSGYSVDDIDEYELLSMIEDEAQSSEFWNDDTEDVPFEEANAITAYVIQQFDSDPSSYISSARQDKGETDMDKTERLMSAFLAKGMVDTLDIIANGMEIGKGKTLTSVRYNGPSAIIWNHNTNQTVEVNSARLDQILSRYIIQSTLGLQNVKNKYGTFNNVVFAPVDIVSNRLVLADGTGKRYICSESIPTLSLEFYHAATLMGADASLALLPELEEFKPGFKVALNSSHDPETGLQLMYSMVNPDDYAVYPASSAISEVGMSVVGSMLCSALDRPSVMAFEETERYLFSSTFPRPRENISSTLRSGSRRLQQLQSAVKTAGKEKALSQYIASNHAFATPKALEAQLAYEAPAIAKSLGVDTQFDYSDVCQSFQKNADRVIVKSCADNRLQLEIIKSGVSDARFTGVADWEGIQNALAREGYLVSDLSSGLTLHMGDPMLGSINSALSSVLPVIEKDRYFVASMKRILGRDCRAVLSRYGIDDRTGAFSAIKSITLD